MTAEKQLLSNKKDFVNRLHRWYRKSHRKLPWRTAPSLYKTVVSEFMLQQTQVVTVLPYFGRWMEVFPNFQALAKATEEEVLKQWEGLGYYSRARNLQKLAKELAALPKVPKSSKEWLKFPGVGPYTAAAIASIAFEDKVAVVDGNVVRILARLTACDTLFKDNITAAKTFYGLANGLLSDVGDPRTHNQAMMELGATVCFRKRPLCADCPATHYCEANKRGEEEKYPRFAARKTSRVSINRIWLVHEGKLLLHRISAKAKRLANMYELPQIEMLVTQLKTKDLWVSKKRGISNEQIVEHIYKMDGEQGLLKAVDKADDLYWVGLEELDKVTLSGPHRRWIGELSKAN